MSVKSLAIIIPAFNEEEALPSLFEALIAFHKTVSHLQFQVIFVDDHSDDKTPELLHEACENNEEFSFLRLSRRSGSHTAIIAGLDHCDTDVAVFLAADLQDPPELIPDMIQKHENGFDIVWGVLEKHEKRSTFEALTSKTFHVVMQKISNIGTLPYQASFALLSRRAYQSLTQNVSANVSFLVEIPRLGFPTTEIPFVKKPRSAGKTKWSFTRKLVAFLDALVASSYLPLRAMSYIGFMVSVLGFAYAGFLILRWLAMDVSIEGWTSLMVVVLMVGGLQMLMLGIIGEYLWRTHESAKKQKLYFIERSENMQKKEGYRNVA